MPHPRAPFDRVVAAAVCRRCRGVADEIEMAAFAWAGRAMLSEHTGDFESAGGLLPLSMVVATSAETDKALF